MSEHLRVIRARVETHDAANAVAAKYLMPVRPDSDEVLVPISALRAILALFEAPVSKPSIMHARIIVLCALCGHSGAEHRDSPDDTRCMFNSCPCKEFRFPVVGRHG